MPVPAKARDASSSSDEDEEDCFCLQHVVKVTCSESGTARQSSSGFIMELSSVLEKPGSFQRVLVLPEYLN